MIVCCGEALMDMVSLPIPGGSPFNTALAIARLGVRVRFLGRLSRDFFGERLVATLRQNQVYTDLLIRSPEPTTLAFVHLPSGKGPEYSFYTQGTADRSLCPEDMPNPLPDAVRCLLFGSIAMTMEPSASAIESVIFREYAGSAGRLISLDPNIRPFMIPDREAYIRRFEGWLKAVHILKVSAEDLAYIYPDQDLPTALRRALSLGVRLVLLTHGSAGAVALLRKEDDEILRVKTAGRSVPVVDTIGAGDTFHGAFVAWLALYEHLAPDLVAALTEDELAQALAFANKAAALVCTRSGANPPTLAELEGV